MVLKNIMTFILTRLFALQWKACEYFKAKEGQVLNPLCPHPATAVHKIQAKRTPDDVYSTRTEQKKKRCLTLW